MVDNNIRMWTTDEMTFLREFWVPSDNRLTVSEEICGLIAEQLGRTPEAVRNKAHSLGLCHPKRSTMSYYQTAPDHRPKAFASGPEKIKLPPPAPKESKETIPLPNLPDFQLIDYVETLALIHALPLEKKQAGVALGFYHPSIL